MTTGSLPIDFLRTGLPRVLPRAGRAWHYERHECIF